MAIFKDRMGRDLTMVEAGSKIINRFRNYWLDFLLMKLRLVGHIPFHSVRNFIYRVWGVKIGRGSTLHIWARFYQPKNIRIGEGTFIGPRVIIMPGVKIGKGAVVAGGAVVAKDVEAFTIVGGVPAKFIFERKNKDLNYKLGRARLFQ